MSASHLTHSLNISRFKFSLEELLILSFLLERTIFQGKPAVRINSRKEIADAIGMDEGNLSRNLRGLHAANVYGVDEEGCYYLKPSTQWRLRPRFEWTGGHEALVADIDARPLNANATKSPWLLEPKEGLERELAKSILPAHVAVALTTPGGVRSESQAQEDVSRAQSGNGGQATGRKPSRQPSGEQLTAAGHASGEGDYDDARNQARLESKLGMFGTGPDVPKASCLLDNSRGCADGQNNCLEGRKQPSAVPPTESCLINNFTEGAKTKDENAVRKRVVQKTTGTHPAFESNEIFEVSTSSTRIVRSKADDGDRLYLAEKLGLACMRHVAIEVTGGVKHMTENFRKLLETDPETLKHIIGTAATDPTIRKKAPWVNTSMRKALQMKEAGDEP